MKEKNTVKESLVSAANDLLKNRSGKFSEFQSLITDRQNEILNHTMMQYFEWYVPADGSLYKKLASEAGYLAQIGIDRVWMPPAGKGYLGRNDVGYGVYDLYDLGEFRQKGTQSTKYGTRKQLEKTISTLQKKNIQVLADIVFNHRMGGDELEDVMASTVDTWNRNNVIKGLHKVRTWTRFTFPGRNGKYSSFIWNASHFTGTDFDELSGEHNILLFENKHWNEHVSGENGNYDYIMGCDVDFTNREVTDELYNWGRWFTKTMQIDGFRLDALKNIDSSFFNGWLSEMHKFGNHPNIAIGEYWSGNLWELKKYLNDCNHCMSLMDVPLHYRLQQASNSNGTFDIRNLFRDTLTDSEPDYACAFVDNHDTQPHQALESWVLDWFKPQAYASILLYKCKEPIVFYGDYYGLPNDGKPPVPFLKEMIWIRQNLLSDNIIDLFDDDPQKACWMAYSKTPVLVIYTIADWKEKRFCEPNYAGRIMRDALHPEHTETFDENGNIRITCPPGSLSAYIEDKDYTRMLKGIKPKKTLRELITKKKKS